MVANQKNLGAIVDLASTLSDYLELQDEVLRITQADVCLCFLSDTTSSLNLKVSHRADIPSKTVEDYLGNLLGKRSFVNKKYKTEVLRLRKFWQKHNQNTDKYALVVGASDRLAEQLKKRASYLTVVSPNSRQSQSAGISPLCVKEITQSKIKLKEINCKPEGVISPGSIFVSNLAETARSDLLKLCEYNLLPPYPVSFISVPLGFSHNAGAKDFISVAVGWFGKGQPVQIKLEEDVIDQVILLCRCVSHENIICDIDKLYHSWHFDQLKEDLFTSRGGDLKRKRLSFILEYCLLGKTSKEAREDMMKCKSLVKKGNSLMSEKTAKNEISKFYEALDSRGICHIASGEVRNLTEVSELLKQTKYYRARL